MNKVKLILCFLAVGIMYGLFLISSTDMVFQEQETRIYKISVIYNKTDDSLYTNFQKGIEQTFRQWTTDVKYVTLYDESSVEEQITWMKKEIENGADALVVFPVESEKMTELMNQEIFGVPIIMVQSEVDSGQVSSCIYSDNQEGGRILGEEIATDIGNRNRKVYILGSSQERSDLTEAKNGVLEGLGNNMEVEICQYENTIEFLQLVESIYRKDNYPIFVSLDLATQMNFITHTTLVGDTYSKFYGFGFNNEILYYLSKGEIAGIIASSDYDKGYLSFVTAISIINGTGVEPDILVDEFMVFPENVYEEEYEKFLFPIE